LRLLTGMSPEAVFSFCRQSVGAGNNEFQF
jgi:hypothetical protein